MVSDRETEEGKWNGLESVHINSEDRAGAEELARIAGYSAAASPPTIAEGGNMVSHPLKLV